MFSDLTSLLAPQDLLLIAGTLLVAVMGCVLVARRKGKNRQPKAPEKFVIIDGSNVMHWRDGKPDLWVVAEVVAQLKAQGYTPGVVFDANAGYLLVNRYLRDSDFSRLLKLPRNRVMVVPKGTPADPAILQAARDLGGRVVTNDQFRDWVAEFPEVRAEGHLISGGHRDTGAYLDLAS